MVLDSLAEKLATTFGPGKGDYFLAGGAVGGREVVLLQPSTYMNNSGRAVADLLEAKPVPFEDLLVVLDDFSLPLGTLRIRPGGSDGGHNGLASVIEHLQTDHLAPLVEGEPVDDYESPPELLSGHETLGAVVQTGAVDHGADAAHGVDQGSPRRRAHDEGLPALGAV